MLPSVSVVSLSVDSKAVSSVQDPSSIVLSSSNTFCFISFSKCTLPRLIGSSILICSLFIPGSWVLISFSFWYFWSYAFFWMLSLILIKLVVWQSVLFMIVACPLELCSCVIWPLDLISPLEMILLFSILTSS